MSTVKIRSLTTTATTTASDDFLVIDGTTNSTRKLSAATPAFLTSVTVPTVATAAGVNLNLATGTAASDKVLIPGTLEATAADGLAASIGTLGGASVKKALWVGGIINVAGHTTFEGVTSTGATGTGKLVYDTSPSLTTPALGTPSALVGTNITGTAASLTAGNVTTNANLTGDVTSVGNATSIAAGVIVNADINASAAIVDTKLDTIATALKVSNSATTATNANTASAIVARDASGNFSAGTISAALTGNAATATALATGRTIAITGDLAYTSPSFDGSGNVTAAGTLASVASAGTSGGSTAIPIVTINAKGLTTSITTAAVIAPAGTLTGNTLASGVTASSLTSLGTIASLTATAGTITTTPTASTDIANKLYVDTVAQGLDAKASCVAATTADITLSGTQTIDGISVIAGNRVLVKNQTLSQNNGIYLCAAGAWTRTTDADTWDELTSAFTFIETGTVNADCGFVCTANAGGTLGTTALPWSQFSGAGSYTASTGLTLTGTAFSLTAPVTVALGGTNATSAGIASFNNITGYTAAGATGTTSTNLVFSTSPTLVTPALGTPSSATLTNATGLPLTTGVTGILPAANGGTGVANNAAMTVTGSGNFAYTRTLTAATNVTFPTTGTLATLAGSETLTNKTLTSPTLTAPVLGTPASGTVTNLTGTASININGTVGATTPSTVAATTISGTGATINTTTGQSLLTLSDGGVGSYSRLNMRGGGTNFAWSLGAQDITTNALTITPSTAVGGTTFTTPVATFTSTGLNSCAIGATTPAAGSFTTLSATGAITQTQLAPTISISSNATGKAQGYFNTNSGANGLSIGSEGSAGNALAAGAAAYGGVVTTVTNHPVYIGVNGTVVGTFTSTGLNSTAIGATTPAAGSFTTLGATGLITGNLGVILNGNVNTTDTAALALKLGNMGNTAPANQINSYIGVGVTGVMGASNGDLMYVPRTTSAGNNGHRFFSETAGVATLRLLIDSTGSAVTGTLSATADVKAAVYGYFGSAGVAPSASNPGFSFSNPFNVSAASWSSGSVTTSLTMVNVYNGNGIVGTVVTNGSATAWNTSSDARLKTNLRDITNSSVIIDALKPRRFDWLTFTKEKDDYGFVAQEAYEVYPKMVTVGGDDPAKKPWGMDASKLIPVLVAELQSLRKRLAALEAK